MIRAIETSYRGYRFRSRLEARWAVFFDALGLKWDYEPEGFELRSGRYLPDFKVTYPGRDPSEIHHKWFEVKGDLRNISGSEWERMVEFDNEYSLIILDATPDVKMYNHPSELLVGNCVDAEATGNKFIITRPFVLSEDAMRSDRAGCALWCGKGRLWWDEFGNFFNGDIGHNFEEAAIRSAVNAARSARFEFGKSGAQSNNWGL